LFGTSSPAGLSSAASNLRQLTSGLLRSFQSLIGTQGATMLVNVQIALSGEHII
jgi:hypothetical protein